MAGPGRPKGQPKSGGRVKGTPNKASEEIRDLTRKYCPAAVVELARLALHAKMEAARVAAIKELLDRGYGRPMQPIAGDSDGGPIKAEHTIIYSGVLAASDKNL